MANTQDTIANGHDNLLSNKGPKKQDYIVIFPGNSQYVRMNEIARGGGY